MLLNNGAIWKQSRCIYTMTAWALLNVTATPRYTEDLDQNVVCFMSTRGQSDKLPGFYKQIAFTFWIPFISEDFSIEWDSKSSAGKHGAREECKEGGTEEVREERGNQQTCFDTLLYCIGLGGNVECLKPLWAGEKKEKKRKNPTTTTTKQARFTKYVFKKVDLEMHDTGVRHFRCNIHIILGYQYWVPEYNCIISKVFMTTEHN